MMIKPYKKLFLATAIASCVLYSQAFATSAAPSVNFAEEKAAVASSPKKVSNNVKKSQLNKDKKAAVKKAKKKAAAKKIKAAKKVKDLKDKKARIKELHQKNLARHHEHHGMQKPGPKMGSKKHHPDTHPMLHKHLEKIQQGKKLTKAERRAAHKKLDLVMKDKMVKGMPLSPEEKNLGNHLSKVQVAENTRSNNHIHSKQRSTVSVSRAAAKQ